jgi:hypothetical protein
MTGAPQASLGDDLVGRSRLGRVAATGAGALVLALTTASPAVAAPAATDFFSATTTTSALHISLAQSPAASIITASLVDDSLGYAASTYGGDGSSDAQAAPFYPGKLVVQGPTLLCTDIFTCPATPPSYPLLADASYPRQRTASTAAGKQPVGVAKALAVTPAGASAAASAGGNSSRTRTGAASLLPGTPLALTFGSSTASSSVSAHATSETVHVSSAVSGVTIAGLVHIDSVRTVDDVTMRSGKHPVDRPRVTVTGVTVAGTAATIDSSGIHVSGQRGPAVARTLRRSGLSIRTLGVTRSDGAHSARSSAGGIEIDASVPVTSAPYVPNPLAGIPPLNQVPGVDAKGTYLASVQLGGAGIAGTSQRQIAIGTAPAGATGTGAAGRGPSVAAAPGTTSGGTPAVPGTPGTPGTPAQPAPTSMAAPHASAGVLDGLSRVPLDALYLVLALGSAAIFLGWRGSALLRWPRASGSRS